MKNLKLAVIIALAVIFSPVTLILCAILPAICPDEWNKAKNGGF